MIKFQVKKKNQRSVWELKWAPNNIRAVDALEAAVRATDTNTSPPRIRHKSYQLSSSISVKSYGAHYTG